MDEVRNEIESIVDNYNRENYLSGTILISQDNNVLFEKAYGKANMQLDIGNTLETKYFIASVTKMFIAAAAVKIHEDGIINLHERPGTYIENLRHLHPNITLHHLITHTSGLHDIYAVPNIRYEMNKLNNENGDFLSYLCNQEQLFIPGEQWRYSSTGFILMGYILEKVTGKSFQNLLDELFFQPLKMTGTGLNNPRKIIFNRAYGHTIENEEYKNADNDKLADIDAPGELYSTVKDLNIWCRAILNGSIISKEAGQMIFKAYASVDFDPNLKYGYGWFLGNNFRWIPGGSPGFKADIWQFPDQKISVIMLWNFEKVDSYKLFDKIKNALDIN